MLCDLYNFTGNSNHTSIITPAILLPCFSNPLLQSEQLLQLQKYPYQSGINTSLSPPKQFSLNNIQNEYSHKKKTDIEGSNHICLMGSLLKKRRRKMNRQKYKKRRKRDRFKREALKNLRRKKTQRKERAAERKQTILSNMVVNNSISKRRTRYLSHKLLPAIMKGQGLG